MRFLRGLKRSNFYRQQSDHIRNLQQVKKMTITLMNTGRRGDCMPD
jgi:hypothetical protein